jgi:RHS repeat-associated protein
LEVAATSSSGAQAGLLRTLDPEGAPLTQVDQSGKGWSFSRDLGTRELILSQEIGGGSASVATGYDLAGLRATHADLLASGAWSTNSAGEVNQARGRPVVNDLLGRVTSLDGWNHTYSCDGLLLSSEPASPSEGSRRSVHAYDALGRRVRTMVEAYVGGQWVAFSTTERDFLGRLPLGIETSFADGSAKSWRFLRGPDASGTLEGAGGARGVLAVLKDASSWKAVAADTLGNVLALAGTSGDFTRRTFDPWGNPLTRDASGSLRASTLSERRADYDALPLGWASQEVDPDTGLTHYHFREYSPSLGGWLTQDPIGLAGGYLNLRSYLGNRPADALDAWGESMWDPRNFWPNKLDSDHRKHLFTHGWDHTINSIEFTVAKCCDIDTLVRLLQEKIRGFSNWNYPEKNDEAELEVRGKFAYFTPTGLENTFKTGTGSLFDVADREMVVSLNKNPTPAYGDVETKEGAVLEAVTLSDHPLIGARRWGVEVKGRTITIWTESFDIGKNMAVRWFMASQKDSKEDLAKNAQFKLWNSYLENLTTTPSVKSCIEGDQPKVNPVVFKKWYHEHPWRADLR